MQSEIERLEEQRDSFSLKYKKANAELERALHSIGELEGAMVSKERLRHAV